MNARTFKKPLYLCTLILKMVTVTVEPQPRWSPVKVRLAAINWELECESPTVPQQ